MAQIKRTGGGDFPDRIKALVSGSPKSGKTTLLSTVPNLIVADTEPHANNLQSIAHLDIPYVTITSTADLRELLMVLSNDSLRQQAAQAAGMDQIDAVAIDTLDTLQKIMKRERLEEQRASKFYRDDWSWLKDEMIKIIEAYNRLPLHVIYTVHLKTQDVGTEDNPQTKVLPGLEGGIASDIAGMVGYSFLSFRKEEVDPTRGRYTKYWLRAEGDETYDFLGNRAAGQLPSVIEPDFGQVYAVVQEAKRRAQEVKNQGNNPIQLGGMAGTAPTPSVQVQTTGQSEQAPAQQPAPGPDSGPAQQAATPSEVQSFEQRADNPPQAAPQPAEQPPAQQPQQAAQPPQAPATPNGRPGDDEPVNDAALQHVKRVYDACGLAFPEDKLRTKTLGDARSLVKLWQAMQADHVDGKAQPGTTPVSNMVEYLKAMDLAPDEGQQVEQDKQVEAKVDGTIEEVKAWVGDGSDLARVNQAFEVERTGKNRKSLMEWLESKGASHGAAAQQPSVAPVAQPPGQVQTPVQSAPQPPQAPEQPVTPAQPAADASPTEDEAIKAAQEGLGGTVIAQEVNADARCETCNGPIDDPDIARLSKTRFNKVQCVNDYIASTRS